MNNKNLASTIPELNMFLDITDNQTATDLDLKVWEERYNSRRAERFYEYLYSCLSAKEVKFLKKVYRPGIRPRDSDAAKILARLNPDRVELILCYKEEEIIPLISNLLEEISYTVNGSIGDVTIAEFVALAVEIYLPFDSEANMSLRRVVDLYRSLVSAVKTAVEYFDTLAPEGN